MPNWCSNNLTVTGTKTQIAAFNEWLGKDGLKLNKILPLPKELEGSTSPNPDANGKDAKALREKFGHDNWYDWQIANWGTKWDIDAELSEDGDEKRLLFNFDTAWSPPTVAIAELSNQFPKLTFTLKYCEIGCGFAGEAEYKNGDGYDDYVEDGRSPTYKRIAAEFGYEEVDEEEDGDE